MIYREMFFSWLIQSKEKQDASAEKIVACVENIDANYDISKEYSRDKCEYLISFFNYSKKDARSGEEPSHNIVIYGDYYSETKLLKNALKLYIAFLSQSDFLAKNFDQSISNESKVLTENKFASSVFGTTTKSTHLSSFATTTSTAHPATFSGSLEDFKKYLNAFLKNEVNRIAKPARKRCKGICEYCGGKATLQSAHKTGEERPLIIEKILNTHFKKGANYYEVNIEDFAKFFEAAHQPVPDHIFFLCIPCHDAYDKTKTITTADILARRKPFKAIPGKIISKKAGGTLTTAATPKNSDITYEMAAYYLTHEESMSAVGTRFLPTPDPNGSKTKSRFNKKGVLGKHKGLLITSNIDDEILKATGAFKITLETLKKRKLV